MEQLTAMTDKEKHERAKKMYQEVKGLLLTDALEIFANLMFQTAFDYLADKNDSRPSDWDQAYNFIIEIPKEKKESLAVALAKQALTINLWIQTVKK